jgi:hypothetical protein
MISSPDGKTATLRRRALTERGILIDHLLQNPDVIKQDFRFLDPHLFYSDEFLLGLSGERRLHIVEIEKKFEEALLYRSLNHLQWVMKHSFVTDKKDLQLNTSLLPGIFYILPEWPLEFQESLDFLSPRIQVQGIIFSYVESENVKGFIFDHKEEKKPDVIADEKNLADEQIASLHELEGLSREEIMKFLE